MRMRMKRRQNQQSTMEAKTIDPNVTLATSVRNDANMH